MPRYRDQDPRRRTGYRRGNGSGTQQNFGQFPRVSPDWQGRQNGQRFNEPPHPSTADDQDDYVHIINEDLGPLKAGFANPGGVPIDDGFCSNVQWQPRPNEFVNRGGIPNETAPYPNGRGGPPRYQFISENRAEPELGSNQHSSDETNRHKSDPEQDKVKKTQDEQRVDELLSILASKEELAGSYDEAGKRYHDLFKRKALEETALRDDGHEAQAKTAEAEELSYKSKYGQMLSKTQRYDEATRVFRDVFDRRKHADPKLQNESTREALLEFCEVLCLGKSQEGLEEARILYRLQGDLDCKDSPDNNDHGWRLRNAFNVVCVLVEQHSCDNAVNELGSVWRKGKDSVTEIEPEIDELLKSFRRHNAEDCAMQALQIVCKDNRNFSPPLVKVMASEGIRSHEMGRHVEAINYLQKAFANTSSSATQDRLRLGWPLALSYCQTKNFTAAVNVLENLLPISNSQTNPSDHCLHALLAYTLLTSGQSGPAKQQAQPVWNKHKTQNILPLPEYHHADTLIRASIQDNYHDGKWKKIKDLWDKVYQDASKLCPPDQKARDQIRTHIATGKMLAEKWESCRRTRSDQKKGTTTAEKSIAAIKRQVGELQRGTGS